MNFDYTIIGSGVVGLAIARALLESGQVRRDILLIDKESQFGTGISSRNSEVIHAGIYYPTGSLKHTLCISGRKKMYAYCEQHQVPFSKCGKLIIATSSEEDVVLQEIEKQAQCNGVENIYRLSKKEVLAKQPCLNIFSALFSEETGIIDSHALMRSLFQGIETEGVMCVYGTAVVAVQPETKGYQLTLSDGTKIFSRCVINSAGLHALEVSRMLGISPVEIYPCKGSYFYYDMPHEFKHLVYPVPEKKMTGLGVHATLDLAGRLKFGPDTEYVDSISDFTVDVNKKEAFYQAAKKIIPSLQRNQLVPDISGIRPKIQGPQDSQVRDFYICEETLFPKWINLLGIESPGLTSALAIGDYVVQMTLGL